MLIVMDNCEHVIDAAAELVDVALGFGGTWRILSMRPHGVTVEQRDYPAGANYQCLARDQVPQLGQTPMTCHVSIAVIPPFTWDSTCVPDCVLGNNPLIPQGTCPLGSSCPPP